MLKLLIVEDSVLLADMLEGFFVSNGFDVCGVAYTVKEAVTLADIHKPDLAVLDFRLSHGEYGSQIRPLLKNKSLGILYVSGDPLQNRLTKVDGDAYIQKPYGMFDLIRALQIVYDIKTDVDISPSRFPKGFHLLQDSIVEGAKSA